MGNWSSVLSCLLLPVVSDLVLGKVFSGGLGWSVILVEAAQEVRSPAPQCGTQTKAERGRVTWLVWDADGERTKDTVGASEKNTRFLPNLPRQDC